MPICVPALRLGPRSLVVILAVCPASGQAHEGHGEASPVTVVGERINDDPSERVADRARLEQLSARTADDLLRAVPGLHVVQHGAEGKGFQILVRGLDAVHGSDVAVRVGGVPINEASHVHGHGYLDLAFLPPELVSTVTAHRGAARLEDGDFVTAAAVDYELGLPPGTSGVGVSAQTGSTVRKRGLLVAASSPLDFVAAEALDEPGFGARRASRRATLLAHGRLPGLSPGDAASRTTAWAAVSVGRHESPGTVRADDVAAGVVARDGAYSDTGHGLSDRALLAVRHRARVGDVRLNAEAHAQGRAFLLDENYTGRLQDPVHGDRTQQRHDALSGGGRVEARARPAAWVGWHALGEADVGRLSQREDRLTPSGDAQATSRVLDATTLRGAAAAGVDVAPAESVQVLAGLRAVGVRVAATDTVTGRDGEGAAAALLPRAQVVWRPHAAWTARAAYGRGMRSPEARAFVAAPAPSVPDDPDATTPRLTLQDAPAAAITVADTADLAARFAPNAALLISLGGFWMRFEREQVFDHLTATLQDAGGTTRVGVELDVHAQPLSWLSVDADLTFATARFDATGEPVPGAPRWLSTVGVNVGEAPTSGSASPWHGGLHARWLGPRDLAFGGRAGTYTRLDAHLGYRRFDWSARLDVDNVLNRALRDAEYVYASDPRGDRGTLGALPALHFVAGPPLTARLSLTYWF